MSDETITTALSNEHGVDTAYRGEAQASASSASDAASRRATIAIVGTFTADLLHQPLAFWMHSLEIAADVILAPYAQVIQELLDSQSVLSRNKSGSNVVLLRAEDWIRDRLDAGLEKNVEHLRAVMDELAVAFDMFATRSSAPTLIFLCAASSNLPIAYREPIAQLENELRDKLSARSSLHFLAHAEVARLYPVEDFEDVRADRIGHIPYTYEYFVALATLLARRIAALTKPRPKVIALDCDNTLWQGICGEDGVDGIQITDAHRDLQSMLVRQYEAGVLLCLCSKNNPEDVAAVFRRHPLMPLKEEYLVATRVNWNAKSENLKSLAEELDLGLDSFILIDDSAMECAEVQANSPAVLTMLIPQTPDEMKHFIDHVWAFDTVGVTREAKQRTELYRQNRARTEALAEAGNLQQFLSSLALEVEISTMEAAQLPRVAELVQRTSQFNLTGLRRRAGELNELIQTGELQCLVIDVRDRFGDYGLVGVVLARSVSNTLDVDTFLLSCRVLGRGVEQRIVAELVKMAQAQQLSSITFKFRRTQRNAPAWTFLEGSFSEFRVSQANETASNEILFVVPVSSAHAMSSAQVAFDPKREKIGRSAPASDSQRDVRAWHDTAYRLSRVPDLIGEIARSARGAQRSDAPYVAPRTPTESAVAGIWGVLLGLPQVGVNDDFFDMGGDSLLAVRAIARFGSEHGLELPLHEFFDTSTVAGVAAKLARAAKFGTSIERVSREQAVPLSWSQQRLWFIDQLEGGSAAYHVPLALDLRGDLDAPALHAALNTLVDRHEVLRAAFVKVDGELTQCIASESQMTLAQVVLDGDQDDQLHRQIMEALAEPFDLSAGPLIRARLLRLAPLEHVLLIVTHHMVSDGWSTVVMIEELTSLYAAARERRAHSLPALPVQYADYAHWQKRWLAGGLLEGQLDYWKEHLRAAPDILQLPTDRSRPPVQSRRGADVNVALGRELTSELKSFSRRHNVTLAMVLHAAWSLLLARLGGQEDVVVGIPVANRRRVELEGLIGYFVNTLAIRVRLEGDPSLEDLLQRTKRALLGAYANQDAPFEKVVEAIQPVRSLSHAPIFQVMFVMQPPSRGVQQVADLTISQRAVPLQTAQFDLSLSLQETGADVVGTLNYATDLFDAVTVERWADCLQTLLREMIRHPRLSISRLPLLSEAQRRDAIAQSAGPRGSYPDAPGIHCLFEAQAARSPEATAVASEGQELTYEQLDRKANRLARWLLARGVRPDDLVGLCVERGVELFVGVLGIWKAGAAYVPLDPSYPSERLKYIIEDAGPRIVLTQARVRDRLPTNAIEAIALDGDWDEATQSATTHRNLEASVVRPEHLAYVIYTSGSTGLPKGAMIEHRNVLNLWLGLEVLYRKVGPCRQVALNASFNFDASVQQIVQLLSGRTVRVIPQATRQDPGQLLDFIVKHGIEAIDCTPAQLKSWIAAGVLSDPRQTLRLLLVGGEAIDADLWLALAHCKHTHFFNVYGPTECTVDATVAHLNGDTTAPHIGRPMLNRRVYVLDRHREPLPTGAVGEIYVAGDGVGRGYLNRPELTGERFVRDPFATDSPALMYRSGDLGRRRADGSIEYLGRDDDQVKVRGYRIELGEIETQLARHERIAEAVVTVREDVPGEKSLVGYVVPRPDASNPSVDELRAHLKALLPEYMMPRAFVTLERMPLTPSGKVDRRALAAPDLGAYSTRRYETPQGEIEQLLGSIWQSLLGVERVGRQDNFFELGGHSLLIVQMLERLRRAGLSAEVRRVFESPTLADLAGSLTRGDIESVEYIPNLIPATCTSITPEMLPLIELETDHIEQIVKSVPGGAANIQDIYPLAPLQEGILFHHLLDEGGEDPYVVPTLLLVASRERLDTLIRALQSVIDRHDVLRTAVLWEGLPRPVQVVYRRAVLPVEVRVLSPEQNALRQVHQWMEPDFQRMSLRQAPLLRLTVAEDRVSGEWYALLQTHHIIGDNTSQEIVGSEVAEYMAGATEELRPSVPYRNHVAQTLAYARKHDSEAFFTRKLQDIEEPTAPFGLLDVHGDGARLHEARVDLDRGLARRIRIQARSQGVSAATLFHAAWGLVIAHTSGRDDVVFGTVLLGRLQSNAGAQRILGMFINTLPLRLSLRTMTARELVENTQRELIELLIHEQASLAVAQRCSGIAGSEPLFSALLNYRHGESGPEDHWRGATGVQALAMRDHTNYPLALSIDDLGEDFALTTQAQHVVDPQRINSYMRKAIESLVAALERAPQTAALALPILPDDERYLMVEQFNATRAPYPADKVFHQLFEERVQDMPRAAALVHGERTLSYSELNRCANQLAHFLRAEGVRPDHIVGLCVERGIEMMIGVLGILKAGAAYLPLDPNYPRERLEYMIDDASPAVLLTQASLLELLPSTTVRLVALDAEWDDIARFEEENIEPRAIDLMPAHAVYVIYTSGSTGKPKGVVVEHRGLCNLAPSMARKMALQPGSRVLQFASMSFDAAALDWSMALCSGATLCLVSREDIIPGEPLRTALKNLEITYALLPPIALAAFEPTELQALQTIVVGGEACSASIVQRWARGRRLVNGYGPTEITVCATTHECDPREGNPPIGRPLANTQIYILDAHRQPVPIGVTGEIYIGGVGVARGYLRRPELTAQRFVRNPFDAHGDSRMYRTGDLGRWRADGVIEYMGRNDQQVKVRGYRIELGEIESQLVKHPQVKEAAVLVREDVPGDKRLAAYVVPDQAAGAKLSVEALRAHLKSVLPDYMVPSAFVAIDRMPITTNGKLDRRALPAPEQNSYASGQYEPPIGHIEETLAAIWQSILGVDHVGRRDNFFELGGHSLLVVQMMERLRRSGLSAEVRRIFESRTLADLASGLAPGANEHFVVPPNLIPPGCTAITPEMLPLVRLEQKHIECIASAVPGGVSNIQDIYPLAPLQEGILFHTLLSAEKGDTYVTPILLSVASQELLEQLIAALQAVVNRHDVLRTAVLWEQLPQAVQVVQRHAAVPVEQLEFSPEEDPAEATREWLRPERQRLDIGQAPLLRLRWAASAGPERYVLLQLHHVTIDHVTIETVIGEILAQLEGRAQHLPPSMPYRNHVAQALAHSSTSDSEDFFRAKLGDIEEPTAPFGLFDVRGDGTLIDEAREELDVALAQRIRAQARRHGVSPATLFHAAWGLVVAHTAGRDDIVFGSVLLGRLQGNAGAQQVLGMFINTLPVRLRINEVTAKELVARTQSELIGLLSHEQTSLAVAQRCSGVTGSTPLFTAILNYRHSAPGAHTGWSSVNGIRLLAAQERTNYPVTVSVDDFGDLFGLVAQTDRRIQPGRITAYLRTAVQALVESLERGAQTPVLQLSILPPNERQQLLETFNATQATYPRGAMMHELFEGQVERTPHAVAALWGEKHLTYQQLNNRANQLAFQLRGLGVGPERFVGLFVERGLDMVVGMLGVLKAGGAYVPLDPNYPQHRLEFMLEDTAPIVVLTQQRLAKALPEGTPVFALDDRSALSIRAPVTNPGRLDERQHSGNLAYVIYTSGSTGKPKGVAIEHRNAVNLVYWAQASLPSDVFDQTLHSTSLNFDLSIYEAFVPLSVGGTLHVVENALAMLERPNGVTLINTVPSAIKAILDTSELPESLRVVNLAGEALKGELVERIFASSHVERVCNLYGPSETTTYSTWVDMSRERGFDDTIGRPVANTQIYILDACRQLAPRGVVGEIYIGGDGVARGYLKRPELTVERFLPDPFSASPQARMYRTGDLGRWRDNGTIEYLGRNDHQVKIRGFRIELGEIDAQLMRHSCVRDAVVVAREDVPGEKRLVAYLVPVSVFEVPEPEELRGHLREALPEHMVPSAFVVVERMPMTQNGKLDRRALPPPGDDAYASRSYQQPEGEIEEIIAVLWQERLHVDRVGREDDFFELGGHSLLAMQVIARVRSALEVEVPISVLFDAPTLRRFSERVAALREAQGFDDLAAGEDMEDLLESVAVMSDSEVRRLLGGRSASERS